MDTRHSLYHQEFYRLVEEFIWTRPDPKRDAALLDTAIDQHSMGSHPDLPDTNALARVRVTVVADFKRYLRRRGVRCSADLHRMGR